MKLQFLHLEQYFDRIKKYKPFQQKKKFKRNILNKY